MKEINRENGKKWYEDLPEVPENAIKVICEVDKRRKCDSLYILLNTKLKRKLNKALKLIQDNEESISNDLKMALEETLTIKENECDTDD